MKIIFVRPKFEPKQKIINIKRHKLGYIHSLRFEKNEQKINWINNVFHYRVNYEDGTHEEYENEKNLIEII